MTHRWQAWTRMALVAALSARAVLAQDTFEGSEHLRRRQAWYDDMRVELFNVREDVGEKTDLAARMPEKANELREKLHVWRTSVDAQMPTPNPGYDPQWKEGKPKPVAWNQMD